MNQLVITLYTDYYRTLSAQWRAHKGTVGEYLNAELFFALHRDRSECMSALKGLVSLLYLQRLNPSLIHASPGERT